MTSVNFGVRFSKISNSVLSSTFRVFLSWSIFLQLSKHLLAQGVDKKGSGALTIMFKDYILFFYFGTSLTVKIFSIWALLLSRWLLRPILSVKTNVVARNVSVYVCVCVCACVKEDGGGFYGFFYSDVGASQIIRVSWRENWSEQKGRVT